MEVWKQELYQFKHSKQSGKSDRFQTHPLVWEPCWLEEEDGGVIPAENRFWPPDKWY